MPGLSAALLVGLLGLLILNEKEWLHRIDFFFLPRRQFNCGCYPFLKGISYFGKMEETPLHSKV